MSPTTLLDKWAALDLQACSALATTLRQVSETFAEVPDGKTGSHVLGVLAQLLDPCATGVLGCGCTFGCTQYEVC